jgi:hypothetical protein
MRSTPIWAVLDRSSAQIRIAAEPIGDKSDGASAPKWKLAKIIGSSSSG